MIVTPYSAYVQMIAGAYLRKWFFEGNYLDILSSKALLATVTRLEKSYLKYFHQILDPEPAYDESPEKILAEYNVRNRTHGGIHGQPLEDFLYKKALSGCGPVCSDQPRILLPFPGHRGDGQDHREKKTGVPMVSITYDGTSTHVNDAIVPYLACLKDH